MMQKWLIRLVLQPMGAVIKRERIKEWIFAAAAFSLMLQQVFQAYLPQTRYLVVFAVGCLHLGLMIVSMIPQTMKPVRFHPLSLFFWMSTGLLMLLSALRFNTDWLSEAILFLMAYPVLFIVWGNADQQRIFYLLRKACIASFVVYLVGSALFVPIGSRQYGGLIPNVNGAAFYLALVFACLLTECLQADGDRVKRLISCVLLGACAALIFYTNSRTGQLAAVCTLVLVAGVGLVSRPGKAKKQFALQVLCAVLLMGLMLPATVYVIRGGNQVGAWAADVVDSLFREPGEEAPSGPSAPDTGGGSLDSFLDYQGDKNQSGGTDWNAVSTGRTAIWKTYLKHSGLFGSGREERFWIPERESYYVTAHMVLITYAFRHGFICALLYLGFNLLSGIQAIRYAKAHKGEAWALLPLAVTVAFGAVSVLASVNTPFQYMITTCYYLVQAPLLTERDGLPGEVADQTDKT